MKKAKFFPAVFLSLLVVFSGNTSFAHSYEDMPQNWAKVPLEKAIQHKVFVGHNGKIMPYTNITRAQFSSIMSNLLHYGPSEDLNANDVTKQNWYYEPASKTVSRNVLELADGNFYPSREMTREEVFVALAKALQMKSDDLSPLEKFVDLAKVSTESKQYLAALVKQKYISGYDNRLQPNAKITRAELAAVLYQLFPNQILQSGRYSSLEKGNLLIRSKNVVLSNVTVEGDLIFAEGFSMNDVRFENALVKGNNIQLASINIVDEATPLGPVNPRLIAQNSSSDSSDRNDRDDNSDNRNDRSGGGGGGGGNSSGTPNTPTPNQPGTNPSQPGTNPSQPGTNPSQPGTNPSQPGTNPSQPGTNPNQPGTNPSQPGTNPSQPGTNPSQPGTNPSQPGTNPSQPGTNPSQPGTNPSQPGTNPSQPGTNPSQPGTNPSQPGTNPSQPGTNPSQPGTNPSQPGTNPSQPGTNPSQPGTNPSQPGTNPSQPGTNPSQPGTNPSQPGTNPSQPGTNPSQPSDPITPPSTNLIESDIYVQRTKVLDLGYVGYLVIHFKQHDFTKYDIYVDGQLINPSKVNDSGTIAKWEITSWNHRELKIVRKSDGKTGIYDLQAKKIMN